MTKETKFRAWDKKNKNWLYFVIYPTKENMEHTISFGSPIHRILIDQNRIDRKSWGQYIGIKDKNGVEIFKGDIVLYPDTESEYVDVGVGAGGVKVAETEINSLGEVVLKNGAFGIICPEDSETLDKGFNSFHYILGDYGFELNELEVIDNIYENKELLK